MWSILWSEVSDDLSEFDIAVAARQGVCSPGHSLPAATSGEDDNDNR